MLERVLIDGVSYYRDDVVEALRSALDTCQYELICLNPRLTETYRVNVAACIEKARAALNGLAQAKK